MILISEPIYFCDFIVLLQQSCSSTSFFKLYNLGLFSSKFYTICKSLCIFCIAFASLFLLISIACFVFFKSSFSFSSQISSSNFLFSSSQIFFNSALYLKFIASSLIFNNSLSFLINYDYKDINDERLTSFSLDDNYNLSSLYS